MSGTAAPVNITVLLRFSNINDKADAVYDNVSVPHNIMKLSYLWYSSYINVATLSQPSADIFAEKSNLSNSIIENHILLLYIDNGVTIKLSHVLKNVKSLSQNDGILLIIFSK